MHRLLRPVAYASLVLSAIPILAADGDEKGTPLDTATYQVTFDATWSPATHPKAYPSGAHFSPLVGAVHRSGVVFWKKGKTATTGIEQMAELGATFALSQEVNDAILEGDASAVILGSGISSPGSTSVTITVSDETPAVTLVTMIAPSPDWFVGVTDLDLRDGADWLDRLVVPVYGWDAGTDDGKSFNAANDDSKPQKKVKRLKKGPFKSVKKVPLGTFTFERLS